MTDNYKAVIVDANIFMHRPDAINSFGAATVYVPYGVIEELDYHKKGVGEANFNSRRAIRFIGGLEGNSTEGFDLGEGRGKLYFLIHEGNFPDADHEIIDYLKTEKNLGHELPTLITNDVGLQIRAKAHDFPYQGYEAEKKEINLNQFLGLYQELILNDGLLEELLEEGTISLEEPPFELFQNQYLTVRGSEDTELPVRYEFSDKHKLYLVKPLIEPVMGVMPRNLEQRCLADLCMDENIHAGTVIGRAGTGKTLVTLASAIDQMNHKRIYNRVIVIRANIEIGKELGYLPGDYNAKIERHFGSIYDASEVIFAKKTKSGVANSLDSMLGKTVIFETLNYMRGRNLANSFIIIDEAQNLSKEEAKTLVTRIGDKSKVMLLGDPYQIDNHANDERNNGLVHVTKRFLGNSIFSTVILDKGERSRLAELAAREL